ncbi:sensor domain-containing diguanylate cyclase [Crassaminicella thermophila]|uniref:Sensor domain-containing diguanylate cyclase n=1 Tax=Crassaminicella thermophila TaxID=2599308 RepID=A0A5C0SBV4_CRATE|nr:sensor domain-containing diguanylate cyclase [Crassaminicella thermophila]QEK11407.1 sensor domain-containing diguanylate cyclase [Crassaminicella thermophila]
MNERNELLHQRNQLMVKILIVFYLLDNIFNIIMYKEALEHYTSTGIIFIFISIYFVWKKKCPIITMYCITTFLFIFIFSLISSWPCLVNFMFIWVALVFTSLYHDQYIIILSGFYSMVMSVYFFYTYRNEIFLGSDLDDIVFYIIFDLFLTIFLLFTTKFTKSLWLKAEESEQQLKNILDYVDVITWSFDINSQKMKISSSVEKICGVPAIHFSKDKDQWRKIVHPDDLCRVNKEVRQLLLGKTYIMEFRILTPDGQIRWIQNRGIPIKDHCNKLIRLDGVVIDITQRKKMEEKIEYMAYYDFLTALPNRILLNEYFLASKNEAKKKRQQLAILFIDLDGFKFVNDTFGHEMGDLLLKDIAKRLKSILREKDMVCRIGGDEFILLLGNISKEQAASIAQRIIHVLSEVFIFQNNQLMISASIGISIYPKDGMNIETLIKKADDAMYAAKRNGKNSFQFYEESVS